MEIDSVSTVSVNYLLCQQWSKEYPFICPSCLHRFNWACGHRVMILDLQVPLLHKMKSDLIDDMMIESSLYAVPSLPHQIYLPKNTNFIIPVCGLWCHFWFWDANRKRSYEAELLQVEHALLGGWHARSYSSKSQGLHLPLVRNRKIGEQSCWVIKKHILLGFWAQTMQCLCFFSCHNAGVLVRGKFCTELWASSYDSQILIVQVSWPCCSSILYNQIGHERMEWGHTLWKTVQHILSSGLYMCCIFLCSTSCIIWGRYGFI